MNLEAQPFIEKMFSNGDNDIKNLSKNSHHQSSLNTLTTSTGNGNGGKKLKKEESLKELRGGSRTREDSQANGSQLRINSEYQTTKGVRHAAPSIEDSDFLPMNSVAGSHHEMNLKSAAQTPQNPSVGSSHSVLNPKAPPSSK
mmetsp:Transcript_30086/g.45968  ORF Transcript_30086/g.45968 Transcript_30086/m.45968 type:complete len:143 (-) Transcript_30086:525-953(-)